MKAWRMGETVVCETLEAFGALQCVTTGEVETEQPQKSDHDY